MKVKLTKRQSQVLEVIRDFMSKNQIAPSVRELAKILEVTPSTVHKLLHILHSKGYIELKNNISRGIILKSELGNAVNIPVLGTIHAGNPVFSEEVYEGYLQIDSSLVTGDELFALNVEGDSMIGANILDGDKAILRKQESADSGDIVAAIIDGEITLKRFKIKANKAFLFPENEEFQPIEIFGGDIPVHILGKLVAVVRKY